MTPELLLKDKTLTISVKQAVIVKYLKAVCGVRRWGAAEVNGEPDNEGDKMPCRVGNAWCPIIDLNTGIIEHWPQGTTAEVHYKVCDDGTYALLDVNKKPVKQIEGYVIDMMCPKENGYGDYVIMDIDATGKIADWKCSLAEFEESEDD